MKANELVKLISAGTPGDAEVRFVYRGSFLEVFGFAREYAGPDVNCPTAVLVVLYDPQPPLNPAAAAPPAPAPPTKAE